MLNIINFKKKNLISFVFCLFFVFSNFINAEVFNAKIKAINFKKAIKLNTNDNYILIDISDKNENNNQAIKESLMIPKKNLEEKKK